MTWSNNVVIAVLVAYPPIYQPMCYMWSLMTVALAQKSRYLYTQLKTLIEIHESRFERPWTFELPQDYIEKMMRGVVGFTLEITRLEGKFKMSQNRTPAEREKVIAALQDEHIDVAEMMIGLKKRG